MISITVYKHEDSYKRVKCLGHAGYADAGQDIVCASVSVLVINAINSIVKFTEDAVTIDTDEKSGLIDLTFTEDVSKESRLLLDSMLLGLNEIQNDYGKKYFSLVSMEV